MSHRPRPPPHDAPILQTSTILPLLQRLECGLINNVGMDELERSRSRRSMPPRPAHPSPDDLSTGYLRIAVASIYTGIQKRMSGGCKRS